MESNITKEVIFNYLLGNCTALEKELIRNWVKDEANSELFFEWCCEWERKHMQYKVNVEAGLERHREWVKSLSEPDQVPVPEARMKWEGAFRWLLSAACALAFVWMAGWIGKEFIIYKTYETTFGEIKKLTLTDGSKVVLNANSRFRVPRFGFGDTTREVFLAGEATFEVVHTRNHTRFIVHTGKNLDVEVLGTEFNVYSRLSGSRVVLNSGKVLLNYSEGSKKRKLTLQPGDLVSIDPKGTLQKGHTTQPQNFSAWKYHRFVFEDQSFRAICDRLEETFGTKIIVNDQALAEKVISGSFTALDAEELVDLLSMAGDFGYVAKDGQIVISVNTVTSKESGSSPK